MALVLSAATGVGLGFAGVIVWLSLATLFGFPRPTGDEAAAVVALSGIGAPALLGIAFAILEWRDRR